MDRCVVITGANRGIGHALVERFLKQDLPFKTIFGKDDSIDLIFTARKEEELKKCFEEFSSIVPVKSPPFFTNPVKLHGLQLDIEKDDSVNKFVKDLKEDLKIKFVDLLINNAGFASHGDDIDPQIAEKTLKTNFFGTKRLSEALIPFMRMKKEFKTEKRSHSRLIFVSSRAGVSEVQKSPKCQEKFTKHPEKLELDDLEKTIQEFMKNVDSKGKLEESGWGPSTYGFSKACLNILTLIWAKHFEKDGITVNAVHPGYVATDMTSHKGDIMPYDAALNVLFPAMAEEVEGVTGKFFRDQKEADMW